MSKLKSLVNFFVVVEEDEDDVVPEEAASEDIDVAAKAARQRVDEGPVGRPPSGKKLGEYVEDPYLGEIDDEAFEEALRTGKPLKKAPPKGPGPSVPTMDMGEGTGLFDEVYMAAGLPASDASGFTIFKVEKILNSEHLRGLGDQAKAASVLVTLEASGVGLTTVIQDAVGRDKALDSYDAKLRRDLKNMSSDLETQNAAIEAEIAAYLETKRQEIANNKAKLAEFEQVYRDWSAKKAEEEERLFKAVAPFVDGNPITRGEG